MPEETDPHLTFQAPSHERASDYLVFHRDQVQLRSEKSNFGQDTWFVVGPPVPATLSIGPPDEEEPEQDPHPDWEARLPDDEYLALGSSMGSHPELEWHCIADRNWQRGNSAFWYVIARVAEPDHPETVTLPWGLAGPAQVFAAYAKAVRERQE